MIVNKLELKQALNKTYLKIKPDGENIQGFKANLGQKINDIQTDTQLRLIFNVLFFLWMGTHFPFL